MALIIRKSAMSFCTQRPFMLAVLGLACLFPCSASQTNGQSTETVLDSAFLSQTSQQESHSVTLLQDDDMPDSLARLYRQRGRRTDEELAEIRDRRIGRFEKENDRVLQELTPAVQTAMPATFEVIADGYWVSMGCVITADGYALTKASELDGMDEVQCRFGKNNSVDAKVVKKDSANDIALLKLTSGDYPFVSFSGQDPQVGTILVTPGVRDTVMAVGTCSVTSRNITDRGQAVLGVVPTETNGGILVQQVEAAAKRAGIKDGDVITKLSGVAVSAVPQFVNLIRKYREGDEIEVTTKRGQQELVFNVRLGGRRGRIRMAPRFEAMNLLGSINSKRNDSFPWVMQHDTPLMPEQCGGPLVDLNGKVTGLNIARGGRIMSYAITGPHLRQIIQDFNIPAPISQTATTEK